MFLPIKEHQDVSVSKGMHVLFINMYVYVYIYNDIINYIYI